MSFIRKVTHQIIGQAPLYNVMQQPEGHVIGSLMATTNLRINPAVAEEVAKLGVFVKPQEQKLDAPAYEQKLDASKELNVGTMTAKDSKAATAPINLGNYADIDQLKEEYKWGDVDEDSELGKLPKRTYFIYAPVIGKMRNTLGNPAVVIPHPVPGKTVMTLSEISSHLMSKLDKQSEIDWNEIEIAIKNNHDVESNIVQVLANSI